jgi:hypothetical protein
MRLARLGLVFALTGCQSGAFAPSAPAVPFGAAGARQGVTPGVRGGHLYVAVTTATHYPSIERFRIVHGLPESTPDRVYEGYGGLIAVAGDGTLYAFGNVASGGDIYAFGPRGTKPARKLDIPSPGRCGVSSGEETEISALAADAQGYLFAAIYTYAGGVAPGTDRAVPAKSGRVPCNGVAVFAPGANGKVSPVQTIPLGQRAVVTGIAVDPRDDLYITEDPYSIAEFTNAVADPQRSRVFHTKAPAHVSSVATDDAGDVFISNVNYGYKTGWIDRYSPGAKAKGPPTSQIRFQGSNLHFLVSIAVGRRVLYDVDDFTSVDLYHALQNRSQSPFYSLAANDVSAVAIGP